MEKNGHKVSEALGADPQRKAVTIQEVRGYVRKDLQTAIMLLDAIYKDQPTCDALADYLHGRFLNHLHQEELKKQPELDFK